MPRQIVDYHVSPGYTLEIRRIGVGTPVQWLRRGWEDIRRQPQTAIGYGLLIALAYGALVALSLYFRLYHVAVQLTTGFLLLGPVLAVGFYGISERHEHGQTASLRDPFRAWGRNPKGLLGMGLIIALIFLSWFMISMWVIAFLAESKAEVALFFGGPGVGEWIVNLSLPVVLGFFLVGLVAALVVFAFSAVSIPMLMDHPETDAITAVVTSWNTVIANWRPMVLWALLIVALTALGLALFYVGLAVTMPLLGFATWHAYRDLLGEWRELEAPEVEYY